MPWTVSAVCARVCVALFCNVREAVRIEDEYSVIIRHYVEGNTYHILADDFIPGYHLLSFASADVARVRGLAVAHYTA